MCYIAGVTEKRDADRVGIYRRGKIYWLAQQRANKRVYVSLGTDDLHIATERAKEIREAPELNQGGKLQAEIERYLAHKERVREFSRQTRANAAGFLSHLPKICGNMPLHQFAGHDAKRLYETLRARMTESSAQTYVAHARSFFRWAVEVAHLCRENPFDKLDMPDLIPIARKEFCRPILRDKLIEECPREDLRFVLFCGFHAGLRRNEICEARPSWFDLTHRLLNIAKISPEMAKVTGLDPFDLKDREERTVPLSKAFTAFLKGWLNPENDYCLAPGKRRGSSRYRYDFRRFFDDYMESQKCGWVTAHTMRRTFASIQATRGTSIYLISKWLGDDVKTAQRHYGHLIPEHKAFEKGI